MINKTKGAWILARTTGNSGYSLAERQISALTSELQSEGYYLAGRSTLHFSIKTEHGKKEIFRMLKAAESGKISAVFVFSILAEQFGVIVVHLPENIFWQFL